MANAPLKSTNANLDGDEYSTEGGGGGGVTEQLQFDFINIVDGFGTPHDVEGFSVIVFNPVAADYNFLGQGPVFVDAGANEGKVLHLTNDPAGSKKVILWDVGTDLSSELSLATPAVTLLPGDWITLMYADEGDGILWRELSRSHPNRHKFGFTSAGGVENFPVSGAHGEVEVFLDTADYQVATWNTLSATYQGQEYFIMNRADSTKNIIFTDGASIVLSDSPVAIEPGHSIRFRYDAGEDCWYEVHRSHPAGGGGGGPAAPTWLAMTLINDWVNYGGNTAPAEYYKDEGGTVHIRGYIKDGTGPIFWVAPPGYRAAYDEGCLAPCDGGLADISHAASSGNTYCSDNASSAGDCTSFTSLTGINWSTVA